MLNLLKLNLKTFYYNKSRIILFVIFLAGLSAAATAMADFFLGGQNIINPIYVAAADLDNSFETRLIMSALADSADYDLVNLIPMDYYEAGRAFAAGEVGAIFTFPYGFGESMVTGINMPVTVVYDRQRPMSAAILFLVGEAFSNMLRTSQTGVYIALNYAAAYGSPELYNNVFFSVNLRFMGLVMSRDSAFIREYISPLGTLDSLTSYFTAAYITIMLFSTLIFGDLIRKNYSQHTLISLKFLGITPIAIFAGLGASYFILFGLISFCLFIFALSLGLAIPVFSMILINLFISAFAAANGFLFDKHLSCGIFTGVFALFSLFLSGGVIPLGYLSESLRAVSIFTFNFWAKELIASDLSGQIGAIPVLVIVGFIGVFTIIGTGKIRK